MRLYLLSLGAGLLVGVMEILKAHTPNGIQVRFSNWALGEHASETGA